MDIFEILNNIYTNTESKWIIDIEEKDIKPFLIQRWLIMNERIKVQVRWADKFVFTINPKKYLSIIWSIIPKEKKMPFIRYIKKEDNKNRYQDILLHKIQKYFNFSDNDWRYNKNRIIASIDKYTREYFKFFAVEKSYYRIFRLQF